MISVPAAVLYLRQYITFRLMFRLRMSLNSLKRPTGMECINCGEGGDREGKLDEMSGYMVSKALLLNKGQIEGWAQSHSQV